MSESAYIFREKHLYNRWVASDTLEDFALRYTADKARRWSSFRVANTAIGAAAFLACEAIGASIALAYGFPSSMAAIGAAMVVMFLIGLPIAYYAAKEGLDVDLLTRGAGFGYLGSTITSLIYASFTFLLFAIEASIMSVALQAMLGIHISLAYVISAFAVIPIAVFGMSAITRFQIYTQPLWIVFQIAPIAYLVWKGLPDVYGDVSAQFGGADGASLLAFGLAFSTLLSLLPQIGEQADYLRFMPAQEKIGRRNWWLSVLASGPGWVIIGGIKLMLGAVLAVYVLSLGGSTSDAVSPMAMFRTIFEEIFNGPEAGLILAGIFVIVCQLKINVTNAYAGSIAWSNFFSRLTHGHPGRVVWLVFNVVVALLLMMIGLFDVIDGVLMLYANLAAGWIGALAGDLAISKPLGLSPKGIEFKRAHLYDINPVGVGAMAISILASGLSTLGVLGPVAQAFAPFIGLMTAFVSAPLIAWATKGKYYIARSSDFSTYGETARCAICENEFQTRDMAQCPMYASPICSLCCTLEVRCEDQCKVGASIGQQARQAAETLVPPQARKVFNATLMQFIFAMISVAAANAAICLLIYWHNFRAAPDMLPAITSMLWSVFVVFTIVAGVCVWLVLLAQKSRLAAFRETAHHMEKLKEEIETHKATDAKLQQAKRFAERANDAKGRLLISVSHEIRSPLNSIYGYAQLLERGNSVAPEDAGKIIRRSADHLIELVDSLMDMSQMEGTVLKIERELVHLPSFLQQIANMFRLQTASRGLEFEYDPGSALPLLVWTDSTRLRQILINLLSNAVKFTNEGKVTFRVSYRNEVAQFEISDTGPGIEPDEIERIFEPFERGRRHSKSAARGVGLGLSITKVLVHIMGGDISVRSKPGGGAVFCVRMLLPREMHAVAETKVSAAKSRALALPANGADSWLGERAEGMVFGRGMKALAVDDDPEQLGVLQRFLELLGFEVRAFEDPKAAMAAARELAPDIALLDINMPGLSGWGASEVLREMFADRIRIVMISADIQRFRAGDARSGTHDGYLAKPFRFSALRELMARLLNLQDGAGEEEARPETSPDINAAVMLAERPDVAHLLAELEDFACIGHVTGVKEKMRELETAYPDMQGLTKRLRECLAAFNFKEMTEAIRLSRNA